MKADKRKYLAMFIGCIVFILIFILLSDAYRSNKATDEKLSTYHSVSSEDKESSDNVLYQEGDEDRNYNYITNISYVYKTAPDIPYLFYMTAGDTINQYLKDAGYKNMTLTVINASVSGTYLHLILTIDDTDDLLYADYEYGKDDWNLYIKTL